MFRPFRGFLRRRFGSATFGRVQHLFSAAAKRARLRSVYRGNPLEELIEEPRLHEIPGEDESFVIPLNTHGRLHSKMGVTEGEGGKRSGSSKVVLPNRPLI